MNTVNSIARGRSQCALAPASLAPEEQMLWERSTYENGTSWMYILMTLYC